MIFINDRKGYHLMLKIRIHRCWEILQRCQMLQNNTCDYHLEGDHFTLANAEF